MTFFHKSSVDLLAILVNSYITTLFIHGVTVLYVVAQEKHSTYIQYFKLVILES